MRVGIIGLGNVGGAMYRGFKAAACDVRGHDANPAISKDTLDDTLRQDVVLISVPAPLDVDGNCDLAAIRSVLDQAAALGTRGSLVLRSTVPVGTTDQLMAAYPALKIGFSPEFLRAGSADLDFLNPPMTVYGGDDAESYFEVMRAVHGEAGGKQIVLSTREAELLKLLLNGFAAMKSVFSSQMAQLAAAMGADWDKVAGVAQLEGRMGRGYLASCGPDGLPGFGGACLPKDCRMLIRQLGEGSILERAIEINALMRNPKQE